MEQFDIKRAKAELADNKIQYAILLELYADIKSKAQRKQIFPEIERRIHDVEESIQTQTTMIANYEDLQDTLRMMENNQTELLEQVRRVRARFEE